MLTQENLKKLVEYNTKTGEFRVRNLLFNSLKYRPATYKRKHGYYQIRLGHRFYRTDKLAFLFMTGKIPKRVKHLNGIIGDDTWSNLQTEKAIVE